MAISVQSIHQARCAGRRWPLGGGSLLVLIDQTLSASCAPMCSSLTVTYQYGQCIHKVKGSAKQAAVMSWNMSKSETEASEEQKRAGAAATEHVEE